MTMKVDIKGFIRNVVWDVIDELTEKGCFRDEYGEIMDIDDVECSNIISIAQDQTEKNLDCLIVEEE